MPYFLTCVPCIGMQLSCIRPLLYQLPSFVTEMDGNGCNFLIEYNVLLIRRRPSYLSELAELPRDVEDLDERERHGDEAEHQVGDGQVHDEDVARSAHEGVARHHVDHHLGCRSVVS